MENNEKLEYSFESFNLDERVLSALAKMGFNAPTDVQSKVIPYANDARDLVVLSKTGSGKTASFGIPIVNSIINEADKRPKALVLTPTRELALQVCSDVEKIALESDLRSTCVYGQHNMSTEVAELDKGVDMIFGTPGRVLDHLRSATMDLSYVKYFVLDEADRMLNMGFIDQVEAIIDYLPEERQTMLLSATIPYEIMNISWQYMKEPMEIKLESETKTVERVKQIYYRVQPNRKRAGLYKIISLYRPENLIIFCNTRWQVDRVKQFLEEKGFNAKGIHGGVSQSGRTKTMDSFKKGANDILVATDVAARGIHVDDLEMVINYDVPNEKDNYVHRIGRTGRIGNSGLAVTLACSEDMFALYEIEEHIGAMISEVDFPSEEKMNEAFVLAKEYYNLNANKTKKQEKDNEKGKDKKQKSSKKKNKKSQKTNKNVKEKNKQDSKDKNKSKNKTKNKAKSNKKDGVKNKTFKSKQDKKRDNKVVFVFNGESTVIDRSEEKEVKKETITPKLKTKKKSIFSKIFRKKNKK